MGRRLYGKDNIFVGRELAQPYMRKRSAGTIDACTPLVVIALKKPTTG